MLSVDCLEDKPCEPQITDSPLGLQELSAPPDNQSEAPLRSLPPEPDTKDPLGRFMKPGLVLLPLKTQSMMGSVPWLSHYIRV